MAEVLTGMMHDIATIRPELTVDSKKRIISARRDLMFCPQCRSEYVAGIAVCSDCGIPLVENVPESTKGPEPEFKFIETLETYNFSDIVMIKSLLEGSGIEFLLLGENFNQVRPFLQPVRLLIREDQLDDAREVLKDLQINYFVLSSSDKGSEEKP